jgi:hypothetical protein
LDSAVTARDDLRALIEETIGMASAKGTAIESLRGIAFFSTERDAPILALPSFAKATQSIASIPKFLERFSPDDATRIALQVVYQYYPRVGGIRYDEAAFEALYADFEAEIHEPQWVTRGLANVRNFQSQNLYLDLGDGVVIRGRSANELSSLGFGAAIWERLCEDWSGTGASSFVLVAEHSVPKEPGNIVRVDMGIPWLKATRAMGALRLADAGSISIGPMWVIRPSRFNVGIGGLHQAGVSIPGTGSVYVWSDSSPQRVCRIYSQLAMLEKQGYGRSPGNLAIALRAFMGTYDRWPSLPDSQLLDSVTALEALFGTETEISFKLAFRVASLLAESDGRRAELLKLMKDFYDTRSKIVHGGSLKKKHELVLGRIDDLRALVRRLLRAFVGFAASPPDGYDKQFFEEKLDQVLLDAPEREKLRKALCLDDVEDLPGGDVK